MSNYIKIKILNNILLLNFDGDYWGSSSRECLEWISENDSRKNIKILSIGSGHNKNKISGENSTKWGGVGWLRNDIIGMLLDSEIHNEISESFFDDNYLRINSPLGKVNKLLDDDSDENLERIHLMGMEWWSEFGEKTLKFIEN